MITWDSVWWMLAGWLNLPPVGQLFLKKSLVRSRVLLLKSKSQNYFFFFISFKFDNWFFFSNSSGGGFTSLSDLVVHTACAYPGFRRIKRLVVFLLSSGWDVSWSIAFFLQSQQIISLVYPLWEPNDCCNSSACYIGHLDEMSVIGFSVHNVSLHLHESFMFRVIERFSLFRVLKFTFDLVLQYHAFWLVQKFSPTLSSN